VIAIEEVAGYFQWVDIKFGKLRRTKQPISKSVCALLNSRLGGTIYLGVRDDGIVLGLPLNLYQCDHIIMSLKDTLDRFTPSPPAGAVRVRCVPVVPSDGGDDEQTTTSGGGHERALLEYRRDAQAHLLRAVDCECWCYRDARARPEMRDLTVIEVHVRGQFERAQFDNMPTTAHLPVFYANEENLCYMRRTMSNVNVKLDDIARLVRGWINEHYSKKQADTWK